MKVKELKEILSQCSDETEIELSIPAAFVDRDREDRDGFIEYGFVPEISALWNDQHCTGPATSLNIRLDSDEIIRCLNQTRELASFNHYEIPELVQAAVFQAVDLKRAMRQEHEKRPNFDDHERLVKLHVTIGQWLVEDFE